MAILTRLQRLLAAPDHARRTPGEGDDDPEVGLDGHVLLAAEAAADVRGDQPHLVVGELEDPGDVAEVLDHLGRGADRDHPVGVAPGDARLGLEVGVVDELGLVLALDHRVGARQRRLDLALLELPVGEQVAALVELGGVGVERVLGVVDHRQRLVVDLDQVDGGERRVLGLGGDERDRLAVVADDLVGEHVRACLQRPDLERLPGDVDPDGVAGNVGRRVDGDDAVEALGGRGVDAGEPGVRVVGALEPRVQHPRQREVGGVDRAPGHLLDRVVAGEVRADHAPAGLQVDPAHPPSPTLSR